MNQSDNLSASKEDWLFKGALTLDKFEGKGGWTYALLPDLDVKEKGPFGWVVVSGSVDELKFKAFKLMPFGNGSLMFTVNAKMRKQLKKSAGDEIDLCLYLDESITELTEELKECFAVMPKICFINYMKLTDSNQKAYLDWVYQAKISTTKDQRIAQMMQRLEEGLKLHD